MDLLGQVSTIIVVDNGTSGSALEMIRKIAQEEKISLIENKRNTGLATPHNLGLQSKIERGFTWALTLDQDSDPAEEVPLNAPEPEAHVSAFANPVMRGLSIPPPLTPPDPCVVPREL